MKSLRFLITLLFSAGLSACSAPSDHDYSQVSVDGHEVGGFRGPAQFQNLVNDRFFDGDDRVEINYKMLPEKLYPLMGDFDGLPTKSRLSSSPNAVNILLWEILSQSVAERIGGEFSKPADQSNEVNRLMTSILKSEGDKSDNLSQLWDEILRFDAPIEQKERWIATALATDGLLSESDMKQQRTTLLQSLLMQPYFLLEH